MYPDNIIRLLILQLRIENTCVYHKACVYIRGSLVKN